MASRNGIRCFVWGGKSVSDVLSKVALRAWDGFFVNRS